MPRTSQFKDEDFIKDLTKRANDMVPGATFVVVRAPQGPMGIGFPLPNGEVFVARSQDDLQVIAMAYQFANMGNGKEEEGK